MPADLVQATVAVVEHGNQRSDHRESSVCTSGRVPQELPVESYVDETYWADLPIGQRIRWMLKQQASQVAW